MKILGIDNVFFQVGNLKEAIDFYEKLGFALKIKIPHLSAALFTIGVEEPGLLLFENPTPSPSRFWVEVPSALEAQVVIDKGVLLETATGLTFEVTDSWGNQVGFADYTKKPEAARKSLNLDIRPLSASDIPKILKRFSFPWSTPEKTKALWDTYYREQQEGIRTVAVVEKNREIIGYGNLLRQSEYPSFVSANIPEVNALWINEAHRKQGVGTALIKWIEDLAMQEGYHHIGIGVGLYRDYGPAQKLYFQLGYTPDGNGITYKGQPTVPGEAYPLDDDLLLWLVKVLRNSSCHNQ